MNSMYDRVALNPRSRMWQASPRTPRAHGVLLAGVTVAPYALSRNDRAAVAAQQRQRAIIYPLYIVGLSHAVC
jgi:hypothetical protein